ncbi:MAG: phosphoglucosamine mutase, partial [Verrucomicrobia bacterium]|nr:phosphoglucosamine mutase [Cytophagales bacterium]
MTLIKSISGIRGTIGGKTGENLTPLDIVKFTSAFGTWAKQNSENHKVIVGRDARISGEMCSQLVSATLQALGIDVLDIGLSTTPTVEIAVVEENAAGGIILSASHNHKTKKTQSPMKSKPPTSSKKQPVIVKDLSTKKNPKGGASINFSRRNI